MFEFENEKSRRYMTLGEKLEVLRHRALLTDGVPMRKLEVATLKAGATVGDLITILLSMADTLDTPVSDEDGDGLCLSIMRFDGVPTLTIGWDEDSDEDDDEDDDDEDDDCDCCPNKDDCPLSNGRDEDASDDESDESDNLSKFIGTVTNSLVDDTVNQSTIGGYQVTIASGFPMYALHWTSGSSTDIIRGIEPELDTKLMYYPVCTAYTTDAGDMISVYGVVRVFVGSLRKGYKPSAGLVYMAAWSNKNRSFHQHDVFARLCDHIDAERKARAVDIDNVRDTYANAKKAALNELRADINELNKRISTKEK